MTIFQIRDRDFAETVMETRGPYLSTIVVVVVVVVVVRFIVEFS